MLVVVVVVVGIVLSSDFKATRRLFRGSIKERSLNVLSNTASGNIDIVRIS